MDGLALLCNLCADGPVTLRRLRAARLQRLADLEHAEPERLAEWLHASVPQARAFAEEARKLQGRLAETRTPLAEVVWIPRPPSPRPASPGPGAPEAVATTTSSTQDRLLVPGLFPGLDEPLCARLLQHGVRTVRSLSHFAGLALARRTGIPYPTLVELARGARLLARSQASATSTLSTQLAPPRANPVPARELRPFLARPQRAPSEVELVPSDGFTLPPEPGAAGPFG